MSTFPVVRIEQAVARYWPDFAAIRKETDASTDDIARVVARLEAIELGDRTSHVCFTHVPGSWRCYNSCGCRCRDCRNADLLHHQLKADERRKTA